MRISPSPWKGDANGIDDADAPSSARSLINPPLIIEGAAKAVMARKSEGLNAIGEADAPSTANISIILPLNSEGDTMSGNGKLGCSPALGLLLC